jgi:hypothetical protein
MRNPLRSAGLTTAAFMASALFAASPAIAGPPVGHGVLHSPNGAYAGHAPGYWIGQWWSIVLGTPFDETHPLNTHGCVLVGKAAIDFGGDCRVPAGTPIVEMLFSNECSDLEDPPFHADTPAEAAACGFAGRTIVQALDLRVDGGPTLHLLDDAFGAFMPYTTVQLPDNNVYGFPAGPMSFGGYGYVALVNPLPVGQHTIDFHPEGEGAPPDVHTDVTVTPNGIS